MVKNKFMTAEDVAEELGISKSYAYKIMRQLNAELRKMGKLTVSGKVNRSYFIKKLCFEDEKGDGTDAGV